MQNSYSIRYGLNTLLTIADDGTVSYDATAYIEQGRLTQTPVLRSAFSNGSANAAEDYANMLSLRRAWWDEVLELAEISEEALQHDNRIWLGERIDSSVTDLQREVVGVQVLSAAALLDENPDDKIRLRRSCLQSFSVPMNQNAFCLPQSWHAPCASTRWLT